MSDIKLYKTIITPNRNALVESIETYLAGLTPTYTETDFQYQKLSINMEIKINANQEYVGKTVGNYLRLYQDNKPYYFFITSAKWTAKETLRLILVMDTVNTFANDFTFNKKTNIIRQHKDRWERSPISSVVNKNHTNFTWIGVAFTSSWNMPSIWYEVDSVEAEITMISGNLISHTETINAGVVGLQIVTDTSSATFTVKYTMKGKHNNLKRRVIDFSPEGINPVQYKENVGDITQDGYDYNWYLVYRNATIDENSAVDCFICADKRIYVENGPASRIIPKSLEDNVTYYSAHSIRDITFLDNFGHSARSEQLASNIQSVVIFKRGLNDKILWANLSYQTDTTPNTTWPSEGGWYEADYLEVDNIVEVRKSRYEIIRYANITNDTYSSLTTIVTDGYIQLNSIDNLTRTDSKLIKVIKLPYCPVNSDVLVYYDTDKFTFDNTKLEYNAEMNMLKLKDLSIKFFNTFESDLNPFSAMFKSFHPSTNSTRDDSYESKLYSSEFYTPKFVYDSFNFPFQLERLTTITNKYNINFKPTSTINSKFLFEFPEYKIDGKSTEDYDNIVTVARNNEETLYNSSYINYIKNGFNYDVKSKNVQTTRGWVLAGVTIAGAVVSSAMSGGFGAISAISLATTAIQQISSTIISEVQNEQSIQQKLTEYKSQATSVSGADDVDLMSYYANNKAKMVNYKCSDSLRDKVGDLFYYCGYTINNTGTPITNNRLYFNYIQCEAVFNEESNTPYEEFLNDIKSRYSMGVTIYHRVNDNYDFAQTKENWERVIIDE